MLLCATVLLGLATRAMPSVFPAPVATYGGDVLWASMVVWLLALLRPGMAAMRLGVIALTIAASVEVSQLYQAPWINAVRGTRLGALALGHGFLWSDILCYALGVALAVGADVGLGSLARSRAAT